MRFILFIALASFIIWIWPILFQKPESVPLVKNFTGLTDVERQYYRQVFDYTMETVPAGSTYQWVTMNGSGAIRVGKIFTSKSGATCRTFDENFKISTQQPGTADGVACKREGREGWCRLKKSDALTCAMEPPGGIVEETLKGTSDVLQTGKDFLGRVKGAVP